MNKNIFISILLSTFSVLLAHPDWEYIPGNYEFTSWILGSIVLSDGENLAAEGDLFAAFDDADNVRGVAVQVDGFGPTAGQIMYEMTMGSNADGDILSFKYYDASEDAVLNIAEAYTFTTNETQGSLVEPVYYNIGSDDTPCEDVGLEGGPDCATAFSMGASCETGLWGWSGADVSAACPESCGLCEEECVDDVTGAFAAMGGCQTV